MAEPNFTPGDTGTADVESQNEHSEIPKQIHDRRNQRSDHDRQIRPGDVCRDLWGQSWVIAVERVADSVAEYDRNQADTKQSLLEYEGSVGMGATEDDPVWNCFYVNSNNTLAGGRSGPYAFPESRICRYAYESTDGYDGGRFQDHILQQFLIKLLDRAIRMERQETIPEQFTESLHRVVHNAGFSDKRFTDAYEIADADIPPEDYDPRGGETEDDLHPNGGEV